MVAIAPNDLDQGSPDLRNGEIIGRHPATAPKFTLFTRLLRTPGRSIEIAGIAVAVVVVLGIYAIQARAIWQYPYFFPSSTLEEAAYTHIAVQNFLDYGFRSSGFLQDFATSRHAEDHPYIYNHMPPGHEIMLALVSQLFDRDYRAVHLVQLSFVPLGFVFYYLFLRSLLSEIHVVGAGFVVLFVSLMQLVTNMNHPHTSPFLLLTFAPLLLMKRFMTTGRRLHVIGALGLVLIASWMLDYVVLSSLLATWALLWLTRLWPLSGRDVAMAIALTASGGVLHLVRNAIFLGPRVFGEELIYVLGNRMVGIPSSDALVSFYQQAGLLHHGSRPVSMSLLSAAKANFSYPGGPFIAMSVVLGIALFITVSRGGSSTRIRIGPEGRRALRFFGRLTVWIVATVLTPVVLFPAFAQDMSLRGLVHTYYLAIPVVAAVLWVGKLAWRGVTPARDVRGFVAGRTLAVAGRNRRDRILHTATLFVASISLVALGVMSVAASQLAEAGTIGSLYLRRNIANSFRSLEDIRRFDADLFMTNINTPLVGFLTHQPGFGVCGLRSVDESGRLELRHCRIAMMRHYERYLERQPRYFFFFVRGKHFPGFATCHPDSITTDPETGLIGGECHAEQRKRLDRLFRVILQNEDVRVYDLAELLASPSETRAKKLSQKGVNP